MSDCSKNFFGGILGHKTKTKTQDPIKKISEQSDKVDEFHDAPGARRSSSYRNDAPKKFLEQSDKVDFFDYLVQYLIEIGLAQGLPEGLET